MIVEKRAPVYSDKIVRYIYINVACQEKYPKNVCGGAL